MPKTAKILITLVALALPAIFMTMSILSTETVECEVCMEFRGRSQCRRATGPTRKDCQDTAANNACAFISSGMTDSIACTSVEPTRVSFEE